MGKIPRGHECACAEEVAKVRRDAVSSGQSGRYVHMEPFLPVHHHYLLGNKRHGPPSISIQHYHQIYFHFS